MQTACLPEADEEEPVGADCYMTGILSVDSPVGITRFHYRAINDRLNLVRV